MLFSQVNVRGRAVGVEEMVGGVNLQSFGIKPERLFVLARRHALVALSLQLLWCQPVLTRVKFRFCFLQTRGVPTSTPLKYPRCSKICKNSSNLVSSSVLVGTPFVQMSTRLVHNKTF